MVDTLLDDYSLLVRTRTGDAKAFELLDDRYDALVYNIALRVVGDRGTPEEVSQDVFA